MRSKTLLIGVIGIVIGVLLSTTAVFAGIFPGPGSGPGDAGSQMFTLQQIYDRINNGAAATKMTDFTEPSSGPAATGQTLDELYTLASERSRPAKTGQSTCHDASGAVITCTGTGQDGALQKGVAWPSSRFTDNDDGTVTDNLTGLMWMQNADAGNDCAGPDAGAETWETALASVAACNVVGAGYADYTDWRLPNVRELQSLIDYGRVNPAPPSGHLFTGVQSLLYWTSTSRVLFTSFAWRVNLFDGTVSGGDGGKADA